MYFLFHYRLWERVKALYKVSKFLYLEERGKKEDILIDSVSYSLPTSVKENIHRKYVLIEDLDTYILKKIDCSISEYFVEEGESAFRNLEAFSA